VDLRGIRDRDVLGSLEKGALLFAGPREAVIRDVSGVA